MDERVEHVGPDGERRELPTGERVLWTGAPDRALLARHLFRERWVLAFVGLTWALQVADVLQRGDAMLQRVIGVSVLTAMLAVVAIASIRVFAWRVAETSKYVITERRVYFNIGVVLRADASVPFTRIDGVDLRRRKDGSGDLIVTMSGAEEIPWLLLFPHVTWRGSRRGRPAFRALRHPQPAADAVTSALRAFAQQSGVDATIVAPGTPTAPVRGGSTAVATPFPA